MITSLKYIPLLLASMIMMASFIFKILFSDMRVSFFLKDMVVFFIVYFISKTLMTNIAKVFRNYWKIL